MIPSILQPGQRKPVARMATVFVVPRPKLHEEIRRRSIIAVGMVTSMGSDRYVVCEVTGVGPGRLVNGEWQTVPVQIGDIVFMNAFHVGRCNTIHGVQHWAVDAERIVAVMDNMKDALPRLLPKQIATVPNLPWAEYEFRGPSSELAVPFDDEGTFLAGNGRNALRLAYEEVIEVGPEVEGIQRGDLVSIPKDHGSIEITVHGYTFTSSKESNVNGVICPAAERPAHIEAAKRPVKMNRKRDRKERRAS